MSFFTPSLLKFHKDDIKSTCKKIKIGKYVETERCVVASGWGVGRTEIDDWKLYGSFLRSWKVLKLAVEMVMQLCDETKNHGTARYEWGELLSMWLLSQ